MKQRFNVLDLKAAIAELSSSLIGCRVNNVYDIDSKTYLIKLAKPEKKGMILIESGIRIHETEFEWPKNIIPSGFSMKLRKHIKSRRLESVAQLGADRIVDLKFGSNDAAYHLIAELYDRGNILLTDFEYTILAVLRPRTDQDHDVRFSVREKYPLELARQNEKLTLDKINELIANKPNEDLKKILISNLTFGAPLIEHVLSTADFPDKLTIGKNFDPTQDAQKLFEALLKAEEIYNSIGSEQPKGYIIQKKTKSIKLDSDKNIQESEDIITFEEFHPILFKKYDASLYVEYDSFNKAVDEFFSKLESQKLEIKQSNQTKEAIKKLENVKKDHQKRLEELKQSQSEDELKALLIQHNLDLVDSAIFLVNSALARKLDWAEIKELIDEAREEEHEVACIIKTLKLEVNHLVLDLKIADDEDEQDVVMKREVEVDLALNAFKNSTKYYENKKYSLQKEKKTLDASDKALKNAERRTIELLKQTSTKKGEITKSRKIYWFEKFYWFISSENYLVIGGRDQQQNELVVKRYLKPGDLYVHADIQGASSVIIKNPSNKPVPPKTINEAGCMAVCYSVAWEAKVLTNAYWVYHNQVSKQAPTGEYLTTGSFMIRGKKNFIPQTALVFGFGLLYKLEEDSIARHKNDRVVKINEDEAAAAETEAAGEDDVEVELENDSNGDDKDDEDEDNEESKSLFPDTSLQIKLMSNIKLKEETIEEENHPQVEQEEKGENEEDEEEEEDEESETDEKVKEEEKKESNIEAEESSSATKSSSSGRGKEDVEKKPTASKGGKSEPKAANKTNQQSASQFKRGQKTRYNKMKSKYKDQDDEDREINMQYLGSAGKSKAEIKAEIKAEQKRQQQERQQQIKSGKQQQQPKGGNQQKQATDKKPQSEEPKTSKQEEESEGEDDTNETTEDEIGIIDSLTGIPLDEDELLFCIPVCAPYTTLNNYKHKVKLIPGTTKRGQAIKTAIQIFMKEKGTTERERNMFKTYLLNKEQDITRNLPGKVKVSAPNLMKLKK